MSWLSRSAKAADETRVAAKTAQQSSDVGEPTSVVTVTAAVGAACQAALAVGIETIAAHM